MTSTDVYTPSPASKQTSSTMSFGAHRQMDIPASAIRAGASSMPRAWQTRGVPTQNGGFQHGEPAKSIAEIIAGPLHYAMATKPRKITVVALAVVAAVILIF